MRGPGRDIDTSQAQLKGETSRASHQEINEIFDDTGAQLAKRLGKPGPFGLGKHGAEIRGRGKK